MHLDYIDYEEFPQLSARDKAYQAGFQKLKSFLQFEFEYDSMKKVIEERRKFPINRSVLVSELTHSYEKIPHSEIVQKNIQSLLSEDTFTVITAHQPSLFTGPLYYILKIAGAINLANRLNQDFPSIHVVPVFILGAEDHDFEEINHTQIFTKKQQPFTFDGNDVDLCLFVNNDGKCIPERNSYSTFFNYDFFYYYFIISSMRSQI